MQISPAGAGRWMDKKTISDLRAALDNAEAHDARLTLDPAVVRALLDERERLRAALVRQEYDVMESLAKALGMKEDPDYGYPTGDHTAETLAAEMIDYCARLRGEA